MLAPARYLVLSVMLALAVPGLAWAGMGYPTLTDFARLRLQGLSFFLVGFLAASGLLQLLWNYLGRDFTFLPRLSYGKALAFVGLWGLLFLLVLTMVNGSRELMTPGAWERNGLTYQVRQPAPPVGTDDSLDRNRRQQLERLRTALWDYARSHDGKFPSTREDAAIPSDLWQVPDPSAMLYLYQGGTASAIDGKPLAYEPEIFGAERWVLLTNGQMQRMTSSELTQSLGTESR